MTKKVGNLISLTKGIARSGSSAIAGFGVRGVFLGGLLLSGAGFAAPIVVPPDFYVGSSGAGGGAALGSGTAGSPDYHLF